MKKKPLFVCLSFMLITFLSVSLKGHADEKKEGVDICVYGATSAGVIAAYTAGRLNKSVLLIDPGSHIGGLTTGGLGQTDSGSKEAISGFSRMFYQRVGGKYGKSAEQWIFEPHVALSVMNDFLTEEKIKPLLRTQLLKVEKTGTKIKYGLFINVLTGDTIKVEAKVFLDCTYEGDLMAKSGVSYFLGREDNKKYNETLNGFQMAEYMEQSGVHQFPDGVDPYREKGNPMSGLLYGISTDPVRPTGSGDTQVQAYGLRMCLTDSAGNKIPIARPVDYDSSKYELLIRLVKAQPDKRDVNNYFIWSEMPHRKTDVNNRGGFSTDMIGENYNWPVADYEEREKLYQKAVSYTLGLLYFIQTDKRIPAFLKTFVSRWGLPKDEYAESGHITPQIYVREGRRMIGEYVMTEHDFRGEKIAQDGVGMASYGMDSHNTERLVWNGMVKNEGNVEVGHAHPYPVSYQALVPKREECTNLLVPVCLSASHIAYGSIRMEPTFMVLAQSAAMAAVQAINKGITVQDVEVQVLQKELKDNPYLN